MGLGLILYFSIKNIPLNYPVPHKKKKEINVYSLQISFSSYFPKEHKKVVKKPTGGKTNIKLPRPLKILGFVKGVPSGVILKAGRNIFILVQGEEYKGWKLLKVDNKYVYFLYKDVKIKVPLKEKEGKPSQIKYKTSPEEGDTFVISRTEVDKLTQNYGTLLTQVDFVPYIVNGQPQGFKLRWVSPNSIFYKIGFRQGDVIVSVNGIPIKNTEDVFRVLQILRNEPSLRIKVLRRGREITFNVRIS